jgi:long-chain acyl-CoA synthetase
MSAGAERPRRLDELARRLAETAPARKVLTEVGAAWTGRALEGAVEETAGLLAAKGVRGGDRVILVNENCAALVIALFALSRLDAWAVPVNARLTAVEIQAIRKHCEARTTLYTLAASTAAAEHAARDGATLLEPLSTPGLAMAAVSESQPEAVADDGREQVAVLIYTSGTTGLPKGVMLSHDNLLFTAQRSGQVRRLGPSDRVYGVLPISHVFGLNSVCLGTLLYGAELRVVTRFEAAAAAEALAKEGISVFQGVPAMFTQLLELARQRGGKLLAPRLRYLSAGGAPLSLPLKQRIEALWGIPLNNGYGLTEAAPTISSTRIEAPADDDSTGPALPGIATRIVEPASGRDLPLDQVGELWVRGPNVMKGYYRDPAQTATVITEDGWLRTGDLARIDRRHEIYIVGRLKELIIRSGFNVYPPEVEAALNAHPDVALSAVVGQARDGNEEVVAFIQPVAGRKLEEAELRALVVERLAPYKRPGRYIFMDRLPATPAGKVLKAKLSESLEDSA